MGDLIALPMTARGFITPPVERAPSSDVGRWMSEDRDDAVGTLADLVERLDLAEAEGEAAEVIAEIRAAVAELP